MANSGDITLGLVGCGRLAERGYLPAIAAARGCRLVAVADPNLERRNAIASGLPAYPGAEELLAARDVDAVILATPAAAHVRDAGLASAKGTASLIEKPPAPSLDEASTLLGLDPPPWIGFNRRFDPGLVRLRDAARVPTLSALHLELRYRRGAWSPYVVTDDVVDDLGSHLVDLARWLAGRDIDRVRAIAFESRSVRAELELGDVRASILCSSDRGYRERFVASDARGRKLGAHVLSRARGAARRLRHPASPGALVTSLTRELEGLARAVRGLDGPHPASAADGVAAMSALDALRRSAAEGGSWQRPVTAESG